MDAGGKAASGTSGREIQEGAAGMVKCNLTEFTVCLIPHFQYYPTSVFKAVFETTIECETERGRSVFGSAH